MLSISTAFAMNRCRNWNALLEEAGKAGFSSLELNVEVPEEWFLEIEGSVNKGAISIASLHNYSPKLTDIPPGRNIYSGYLLTAADESERQTAVKYSLRTIEWAGRLNARAVVIHAGKAPVSPDGWELFDFARKFGVKAKLYANHLSALMSEREKLAPALIDNLKRSLEPLFESAARNNVRLGLENRVYLDEIPNINEVRSLLDEFKGAPVGYWHDTGHAEIFVRMGAAESHEDLIAPVRDNVLGAHLHDLKGFEDHYAPGRGDFDFRKVSPFFSKDTVKVVEAHPKSTVDEIRDGIKHLKKCGVE